MAEPDLVVLGGGTAGLTASVLAAGVGADVALVERDRTGGDCLWTGCVPSKSLIEAAGLAARMRRANRLGLEPVDPDIDLARVLARVREAQAVIEPHDSPERLEGLGVTVVHDDARFTGPRTIELAGGGALRPRAVMIVTGSSPSLPPVDGLADAEPLTTDTVWALEELPPRLLLLGGGPVGCELGQAFARLGSHVTLVEMEPQLLPREDGDVGALVTEHLAADGVDVRTSARVERVKDGRAVVAGPDGEAEVTFDRVLVAAGRTPRTADLGLDAAGVSLRPDGAVEVDARLRTSARGVYAAGDVTGILPFTHVAAYQAGVATLNALFAPLRKIDYRAVPWVTFTDPEVARVGMSEQEARERWGAQTIVARMDYAGVDRAIAAAQAHGFAKLVGTPRGKLVGAVVAAPAGGEVIAELAALVARGAKVGDVFKTVHPYPTFALGAAMAGGEHLRERLLTDRTRRIARPILGLRRRLARG